MNDPLIIVGAGGLGREVHEIAEAAGHSVLGFLDDQSKALGPVDTADPLAGVYVVAVGDPRLRAALVARLSVRGCRFASVVHPSAVVSPRAEVGRGAILAAFTFVGPEAVIGAHCVLNVHSILGHDALLAEFSVLSPAAVVNGNCKIGQEVFVGANASVNPGISVGGHSKISAGSVVTSDVAPGSLMIGNPARGRAVFPVPEPE